MSTENEDVGYKKPPKATRFVKGRSGNPSGRRAVRPDFLGDLAEELAETMSFRSGGKELTMTKQRFLARTLVNSAVSGNLPHTALVAKLAMQYADRQKGEADGALSASDKEILERFVNAEIRRRQVEETNVSIKSSSEKSSSK